MGGVYGVTEAKKVIDVLASLLNTASKALHGNFLAIFDLIGVVNVARSVDLVEFKKEILELDSDDRASVEQEFVAKLSLQDPAMQKKFTEGVVVLDDVVVLVTKALLVIEDGIGTVQEIKTFLGV